MPAATLPNGAQWYFLEIKYYGNSGAGQTRKNLFFEGVHRLVNWNFSFVGVIICAKTSTTGITCYCL